MVCVLVIGTFAWSTEFSFLELARPQAKDTYYNLLVQGFRAGQLNMKIEAPPGLAQLTDPYDPAVNATYIGHVPDMSYYKGKLYLYFGVTPALVLFWPYAILTGHYFPDKDAVVIFYGLGLLIATGLLCVIWRRYFPEVNIWVAAIGSLTLGLTTGTLEIVVSLWTDVYRIAMACGFAFTMLALAAIWCALHEPKRQVKWLLLASLAYGLAVGSRPSLLFGIIILLIPVARSWRAAAEPGSGRRVGLLLLAAAGPAMLIGFGLMLYNTLRFDSPFEFGWHYQLNGDYKPTTAQQLNLHYLWFNVRFYFLEPMRWSGHFPFLQGVPLPQLPSGYDGVGDPYGGLLSSYPVVWLALAAPLAWRGRPAEEVSVLRWFVAAVFLLFMSCALTICLFFAAGSRYELDFLPALVLLAVIGILGLELALAGLPVWRRVARWGWSLLLAYSVVFNLLAGVENHAETNCRAGNALLNLGRVDEAIVQYQKVLAIWPESPDSYAGLGSAFLQKKRLDEAIIEYQKAVEIKPDLAEAHNNLGYCFLQKGRVNEAITQFQKALEIKPDFAEAHNTLGDCLLQIGRADEAIIQYQKAVEIKPDFAEAHNNLGYNLFQMGRVNEAISHFQRAVEINPDFAEAHNNLGDCLLQIGRVDESITQFQRSLEIQQNYSAYYNLGRAFHQKRMAAEAMANYQKAIELQPQFTPAQIDLAWMLATWPDPSVRNGGKAVALAGKANQFSKNQDPLILRTLAAAYAEAGRFPEAVATAKQALALAAAQSSTGLTSALQTEIGLYQTNSPCRSVNN